MNFFKWLFKKQMNPGVTGWLERHMPSLFDDFKKYALKDSLFDHGESIHHQDFTMLVGIFKGYFMGSGIDCGLSEYEIKCAFGVLAIKETTPAKIYADTIKKLRMKRCVVNGFVKSE